jgi:hypothetical protein
MGTEPYIAHQNAKFPVNADGLNIKSSILHLEDVKGALNCVNSLLALFGVTLSRGRPWGFHLQEALHRKCMSIIQHASSYQGLNIF